jgi:Asp-tRNA(Asn)/Glu-tRNA(Gln) amidotransferase C subunit
MLPPMEATLDTLRRVSRLAGFDWSDAELEAIRPAVARALELLARLETLPLASVEPTTQYRML